MKAAQCIRASCASSRAVCLMLLAVVIFWGINVVMIKYLTTFFPPLALAGIRVSIAGTLLIPFIIFRKGESVIPKTTWPLVLAVAFFSIFSHQLTLALGLVETSATHASLILGLNPLFTTLLAARYARESFSWTKGVSIVLGLAAILLIVMQSRQAGTATLHGDIIMIISMLSAVIGYLFIKKATITIPIMVLTAYTHAAAAAGLLLTAWLSGTAWTTGAELTAWPIGVLFFSGWVNTAIGALCWNNGIQKIGASTTSLFSNGIPVAGMFASALFLNEVLEWPHFAALALVLAGVSLGTGLFEKAVPAEK